MNVYSIQNKANITKNNSSDNLENLHVRVQYNRYECCIVSFIYIIRSSIYMN